MKQTTNIYDGKESDLRVFPKGSSDRRFYSKAFAGSVRTVIHEVRAGNDVNLWLIIASLKDPRGKYGFQTWTARIGKVIGSDTCARIGKRVCKEMGFTIEEGEKLYEESRKREAKALGLPETASWKKIAEVRSEKKKTYSH